MKKEVNKEIKSRQKKPSSKEIIIKTDEDSPYRHLSLIHKPDRRDKRGRNVSDNVHSSGY
jgi:hypothetical protein